MTPAEEDPRVVVPGKETVVRRRGADWSFHLPEQHGIMVDHGVEPPVVRLRTPLEGSSYELAGIEEADDEVIVRLGAETGRHGPPGVAPNIPGARGYPLPEIHHERERLLGRWKRAGLHPPDFEAYTAGSTHEKHFREIRRRLREAEGSE